MRLVTLFFILFLSLTHLSGQFEQKLSLNLSAGAFTTIGYSTYLPEDAAHTEAYEPSLMSNFRPGLYFSAGLQYNLNRHFSLEASFGRSASNYWYYDASPDTEPPFNYLYYEINTEPDNHIVQESGENELYLSVLHFGIAPRYYFRPGKKFNPYALVGLNISYLDVHFENVEYQAYVALGREDEYGTNIDIPWDDYSTNIGFTTGAGGEYVLGDSFGIFLQVGYHLVLMDENDFYEVPTYLHYQSLELHMGVRISFLKSKDL